MTRILLFTKCLTFDKIPTVFDSFKQSSLICFFHVKLASKVTPKYLVEYLVKQTHQYVINLLMKPALAIGLAVV